MKTLLNASSLNMQAFTAAGVALAETTRLENMERLALEVRTPCPDVVVHWRAHAELRAGSSTQADTWLYLQADVTLPLTCQRCMGAVHTPIAVKQWYRFVATEEIAMAEDDQSEEDLLVMAPQFDLLTVLEDELLMALPLVPMHDFCPVAPVFSVGASEQDNTELEKPNPFAVLARLKKKN